MLILVFALIILLQHCSLLALVAFILLKQTSVSKQSKRRQKIGDRKPDGISFVTRDDIDSDDYDSNASNITSLYD